MVIMLLDPVKYPALLTFTKPNRLDIDILENEKTPFTSVVVVADPLLTVAPCTGIPFSSSTRPSKLAVTVCSAGILLGFVVIDPLSEDDVLLHAKNMIRVMTAAVSVIG